MARSARQINSNKKRPAIRPLLDATRAVLEQLENRQFLSATTVASTATLPSWFGAPTLALQNDSRVVVSANYFPAGLTGPVLARFNADGSYDNSLGNGGKAFPLVGGSVFIDPNQKIVTVFGPNVERRDVDGSQDLSFGTNGIVTFTRNLTAVAFDSSGRLLVVGTELSGSTSSYAVTRLNDNGSIDTTFGIGGTVLVAAPSGAGATPAGLVVLGNGDLVLAGTNFVEFTDSPVHNTGELILLGSDGAVKQVLVNPLPGGDTQNFFRGLSVLSGNNIVVGRNSGATTAGGQADLLAFSDDNGVLNPITGFGSGGTLVIASGNSSLTSLVVRPDVKIFVSGTFSETVNGQPGTYTAAQYFTNGDLDPTFGNNPGPTTGGYLDDIGTLSNTVVRPDGSIIGVVFTGSNYQLVRLNDPRADGGFPTTAPSNLVAIPVTGVTPGSSTIQLTWTDNATEETHFSIQRATSSGGPYVEIGVRVASPGVGGSARFNDTEASAGVPYFYRVVTQDGSASAASAEVTATVPATNGVPGNPPPAPLLPVLNTLASPTSVTFYDNSSNETAFVLERSTDGSPFAQVQTAPGVPYEDQAVTIADPSAQPGHQYYYRVRGVAAGLVGPESDIVSYNSAAPGNPGGVPNRPFNLTAAATSNTSVSLSFHDNSTIETGFVIERSDNGAIAYQVVGVLPAQAGTSVVSFVDPTAAPGVAYSYRVKAVNGSLGTAYEGPVTVTTPATSGVASNPGGPPNGPYHLVGAAGGPTTVNLTFTDNASNETSFIVQRVNAAFPEAIVELPVAASPGVGGSVHFTDTGLAPQTTYIYRVYAVNGSQVSYVASPVTVTTPPTPVTPNPGGPPNGPYNLVATATSPNSVDLSFTDNASNETSFVIERVNGPIPLFTPLVTLPASAGVGGVVHFTDTTAAAETTYSYRVYAMNGSQQSYVTAPVTVSTPAVPVKTNPGGAPNGPFNLRTVAAVDGSIAVSFIDNADNETGLVLERSTGNGPFVKLATFPPVAGVHSEVDFTDATVTPGVTYTYRAYAANGSYQSSYAGPTSVMARVPNTSIPEAPSGLTLTASGLTVHGSFFDNSDFETGFAVEVALSPDGPFSLATLLPPASGVHSTPQFTYSADAPVTLYFRVVALNGTTRSPASVTVPETLTVPPPKTGGPPNAPFNLTPLAVSATQTGIRFTDNADNETDFFVERSTIATGVFSRVASLPPSPGVHQDVTYIDTPPVGGTYFYRVFAVNFPYVSSVLGPVADATL